MLGAAHEFSVLEVGSCLLKAWILLFEIFVVVQVELLRRHVSLSRPHLASVE